ncbi:hypothetical protein Pelo_15025 [Pelomyxa schiedti]|nr:hypothetical protein Pelo_15025 [Pelomyxa schiedti]
MLFRDRMISRGSFDNQEATRLALDWCYGGGAKLNNDTHNRNKSKCEGDHQHMPRGNSTRVRACARVRALKLKDSCTSKNLRSKKEAANSEDSYELSADLMASTSADMVHLE